jgi:glycosyltransferase involved in cell wall biosynthesis
MHIAMVSPGWPPEAIANGIVTYVANMREEFQRQDHRVSLFTGNFSPNNHETDIFQIDYDPKRTQKLIAKLTIGHMGKLGYGHFIARKIKEVHAVKPIDVVEMEESFGWCADVQAATGLPVVVKLHGPAFLDLLEDAHGEAGRHKIATERHALRQIHCITAPTARTLEATIRRYGLDPLLAATVPNPMVPAAPADVWTSDGCDTKSIIFIGRFDRRKGGDIVLKAFQKLLQYDSTLKLIFVGPDTGIPSSNGSLVSFSEYASTLFSPGERSRVVYMGKMKSSEIAPLRQHAAVSLIASRFETGPYTAVEALLQGCPVVAVDGFGTGELIEHDVTGLLARPDDIDDFCANIRRLLDDPEHAAKLGRQGHQAARVRHNPSTVAEQTLEIYRQAIANRK